MSGRQMRSVLDSTSTTAQSARFGNIFAHLKDRYSDINVNCSDSSEDLEADESTLAPVRSPVDFSNSVSNFG
jgi:hypothetical protein